MDARDAIWEIDRDGTLTYINEAGARMAGAVPADLVGTTFTGFVTDHPRNPRREDIPALLGAPDLEPPPLIQCATPEGRVWVETVATARNSSA